MQIMLKPRERVREAIEDFYARYPLFTNIVSRWEIIENGEITQTMATNGRALYYSPAFVDELNLKELVWVLLHEAGHCFLGHTLRLIGEGSQESRNIAFDLALNDLIREKAPSRKLQEMMLCPGFGQFSKLPPAQDAEYYHKAISKPEEPPQEQEQGDQGEDEPQEEQEAQGGEQGSEQGKEPQEGQKAPGEEQEQAQDKPGEPAEGKDKGQSANDSASGQEEAQEGQSEGQCDQDEPGEGDQGGEGTPGSASGSPGGSSGSPGAGKPLPAMGGDQPLSIGEVLPSPDVQGPEDLGKAEGQWMEIVAESMALAEQCGNLPGFMRDIGEKLLGKSGIDWRMILRRFLTKTTPQGVSFVRPSRRGAWRSDLILPSRRSKGATDGAIIADTSGSIFSIIRKKVLPEIDKILRTLPKTSVRLLQIDSELHSDQTLTRWDLPLKIKMHGGGGTDLSPAFELLKKEKRNLKWVIVISDMIWQYRNAPDLGIPCLWIVVDNPGFKDKLPFGELVKLPCKR